MLVGRLINVLRADTGPLERGLKAARAMLKFGKPPETSVDAGKLRHVIELQRDDGTTRDEANQHVANWRTIWRRKGSVEPIAGGKTTQGGAVRPDVTHRVILRAGGLEFDASKRYRLRTTIRGVVHVLNIDVALDLQLVGQRLEITCSKDPRAS